MVFRLKIGLFSAYLSAVVDGQPNQRKAPETHFPEIQTSRPTANRRSYMKPSLRVKITIIFSSRSDQDLEQWGGGGKLYNGVLKAEPQMGSRGKAPGQGFVL